MKYDTLQYFPCLNNMQNDTSIQFLCKRMSWLFYATKEYLILLFILQMYLPCRPC